MDENRRQILDMLAAGKITAAEAEQLIAALGSAPDSGSTPPESSGPKYLRLLVEADKNGRGDNLTKANIRVPIQLLRSGVRLTSVLPPAAREHVNQALREKGIAFDLAQLKPENLEELLNQLKDVSIDVDQANKKVKVRMFCE